MSSTHRHTPEARRLIMFLPLTPLADASVVGIVLRTLMCLAYLWSGVIKLFQFDATAKHFANRFGLPVPRATTALTITTQLVGSALFITGWYGWLGALLLAVFTIVATLIAYPFWRMTGVERSRTLETFLEHLGLAVAFLMLAYPLTPS